MPYSASVLLVYPRTKLTVLFWFDVRRIFAEEIAILSPFAYEIAAAMSSFLS
jgi:hypothetical protein